MYNKGYRRICLAQSLSSKDIRAVQRRQGMKAMFARYGLDVSIVEVPEYTSFRVGRLLGQQILAMETQPQVVCATNDILGVGIVQEFLARGLRIPEDIAVTGFNGQELSQHMYPALATVQVPFGQIGSRAVTLLLENMATPTKKIVEEVDFTVLSGETL